MQAVIDVTNTAAAAASTAAPPSPFDKTACQMQGVQTLVAMPQWYVNFNLANLLQGTTTGGQPLKNVTLSTGEGTYWLKGVVSKMWTDVFVPGSTKKVKFILSFSSGTMDYVDLMHPTAPPQTCDITGLQFGFDVDLGLAAVSTDQTPPAVASGIATAVGSLPAGSFTIQQLFMDFENAVLSQYDPAVTVFPATMPVAATAAFPDYMVQYLAMVKAGDGHILGYAVTVDQAADPPATFPPTSLDFVTDQYQAGDGTTLNPDLDTICYLTMTGGQALPTNLRSWWGNFVVPGDDANGWYGTIAVAKQLFVDQFLLPRLGPLVLGYWTLSDQSGTVDLGYANATGTFTPTALGGTWRSGPLSSKSHRTNTFSNDDAMYAFTFAVDLAVVPGTNQIVITRTVDFDIDFVHWYGLDGHAASSEFHVWYDVPLTVTIELAGVVDGKLQVSATSATREPSGIYGDPYGWDITQTSGSYSIFSSVSDTMDSVINNAVAVAIPEALLPNIETAIAADLNLHPFVFPGGAQLFMANSVFNASGDLLLGLQYKS